MDLAIVRNEKFGNVAVDIYRNGVNEIFMTSLQLGEALGYADPQKGIDKLIERNEYLKDDKFSTTVNLGVVEGGIAKTRTVRVFNEDGIYESSFKSNAKTAFEFRDWVRGILKALRKGEIAIPAKLIEAVDNLTKRVEAIEGNKVVVKEKKTIEISDEERLLKLGRKIWNEQNKEKNKEYRRRWMIKKAMAMGL